MKYINCDDHASTIMTEDPPNFNNWPIIFMLFESFSIQIKIMKTFKKNVDGEMIKYTILFQKYLKEMKRQHVIYRVPPQYEIMKILNSFVADITDDELDEIHHEERSTQKSDKYVELLLKFCEKEV